ncbi:MAG: ribonuclease III [Desulfobacterales bacterium]|jgi:ribonuclease III|nr:ribonuclease III [Desulfobacterales bacterium]
MQQDIIDIQEKLGYRFSDPAYLEEALRHSSYVNELSESNIRDNERLEFLGDAVVNLLVGHLLMDKYPNLKEGDLSRLRAGLVNEQELAAIARTLNLGKHLNLGKGEAQTHGHEKPSILADALEAVLAAVYLDGGLKCVFDVFSDHFITKLADTKPTVPLDYKSRLQELVQLKRRITPQYRLIDETGPDHDKTFRAQIIVGELITEGLGKSKKAAEQDAARQLLTLIEAST